MGVLFFTRYRGYLNSIVKFFPGGELDDIFTLDLRSADVITLYLLPSLNVKLIPQLDKLKPGTRIVSHAFDMKGVKPDKVVTVTSDDYYERTIYLWTTPLKKIK